MTNPSLGNIQWAREQIRAARLAPLQPLLQQRSLQLVARQAGIFILPAFPGLIVKDSYWRWPERNLAGNAIDFLVQVLGLSIHDAMCARSPAPARRSANEAGHIKRLLAS